MKRTFVTLNAVLVLLTFGVGSMSFADPAKQADPNKIEKKYDQGDLQYLRGLKAKMKTTKGNLTKRKHRLDHEVVKRKNNQMDDQTRLVHLKERLNLVQGDEAATKKLNAQIAKTETRIRERAGRINQSIDKQKFVGDKLTSTEDRLGKIQAAIDSKKGEIATDQQAIVNESSQPANSSESVGSL